MIIAPRQDAPFIENKRASQRAAMALELLSAAQVALGSSAQSPAPLNHF